MTDAWSNVGMLPSRVKPKPKKNVKVDSIVIDMSEYNNPAHMERVKKFKKVKVGKAKPDGNNVGARKQIPVQGAGVHGDIMRKPEERKRVARPKREYVCYYGGGMGTIVESFLAAFMVYFGAEYIYDCPAATFVPILILCFGILHTFWSLPFTGLFVYAMIRYTVRTLENALMRETRLDLLSPIARKV